MWAKWISHPGMGYAGSIPATYAKAPGRSLRMYIAGVTETIGDDHVKTPQQGADTRSTAHIETSRGR